MDAVYDPVQCLNLGVVNSILASIRQHGRLHVGTYPGRLKTPSRRITDGGDQIQDGGQAWGSEMTRGSHLPWPMSVAWYVPLANRSRPRVFGMRSLDDITSEVQIVNGALNCATSKEGHETCSGACTFAQRVQQNASVRRKKTKKTRP